MPSKLKTPGVLESVETLTDLSRRRQTARPNLAVQSQLVWMQITVDKLSDIHTNKPTLYITDQRLLPM